MSHEFEFSKNKVLKTLKENLSKVELISKNSKDIVCKQIIDMVTNLILDRKKEIKGSIIIELPSEHSLHDSKMQLMLMIKTLEHMTDEQNTFVENAVVIDRLLVMTEPVMLESTFTITNDYTKRNSDLRS